MSAKREIYSRIGVQLRLNRRVLKAEKLAPGAFGLYVFCILDTRAELLDGFVAEELVLGAFGGPARLRASQAEALCTVDLLERADGGFRVVKYDEHNDTAADVEAARASALSRQHKKRRSEPPAVTRDTTVTHADVPISISSSLSGSGSSLETRSDPPGRSDQPPPWWDEACETAAMSCGAVGDRAARWLEYRAARQRKGWAMGRDDAAGWLSSVVRGERSRGPVSGPRLAKQPGVTDQPWAQPGYETGFG